MSDEGKGQGKTRQLYYLCASDSPDSIISPMMFTGDNHRNWSRFVMNELRSKNKLAFVDGTLIKPDINFPEGHA